MAIDVFAKSSVIKATLTQFVPRETFSLLRLQGRFNLTDEVHDLSPCLVKTVPPAHRPARGSMYMVLVLMKTWFSIAGTGMISGSSTGDNVDDELALSSALAVLDAQQLRSSAPFHWKGFGLKEGQWGPYGRSYPG